MSHLRSLHRLAVALATAAVVYVFCGAMAPTASAAIFDCVDRGSYSCITFSGYNGRSVWGYPVDGTGNNCTNYAAFRLAGNGAGNPGNLGNAGDWAGNARAKGIAVNGSPAVGSIAQWNYGSAYAASFGHVAYVEAVNGGEITLSDSNWEGGSKRWRVSVGDRFYPNNFIHLRDVAQGNNPFGSYDMAAGGTGEIRVAGWTIDNDIPSTSTQVHIYVGGPAGTPGAEGHAFTANVSRPDVDALHHKGEFHGFDVTFATDKRGSVPVCAHAINLGGGDNVLLGCKTVVVGDPNPFGAYDVATAPAAGGQVRVAGWTIDPNARTTPTAVHIYIGGGAGAPGAEGNAITANVARPDVNAVHKAGEQHGYDATLTTGKRGPTEVCAYAINIGPGGNVLLGCKTVVIGAPVAKPAVPASPQPSTPQTSTPQPSGTGKPGGSSAPSVPLSGSTLPAAGAAAAPVTSCSLAESTRKRGKSIHISCTGPAKSLKVTFTPVRRGKAARTVVRALASGRATASTKRLRPGRYTVTLRDGDQLVGSGALRIR